jgi:uncharacterized protein (TIGR02301 family)
MTTKRFWHILTMAIGLAGTERIAVPKPVFGVAFAVLLSCWGVGGARAQDTVRPAALDDLIQLSVIIGELHALRVACSGLDHQTWRTRMRELLDQEGVASTSRRDALVNAFNRGYANGGNGSGRCDASLVDREKSLAVRGRSLASRLTDHYVVQR